MTETRVAKNAGYEPVKLQLWPAPAFTCCSAPPSNVPISFIYRPIQVLGPSCLVVAERAVDRDICNERCAGGPELNADRAAKAVADERDLGRVDHRALDEGIEPRLGPRTHQRAVLGVDCGLRLHFRDVLRQHALAITEYIGCERDIAELGPGLREPQRLRSHALARMDHQH